MLATSFVSGVSARPVSVSSTKSAFTGSRCIISSKNTHARSPESRVVQVEGAFVSHEGGPVVSWLLRACCPPMWGGRVDIIGSLFDWMIFGSFVSDEAASTGTAVTAASNTW